MAGPPGVRASCLAQRPQRALPVGTALRPRAPILVRVSFLGSSSRAVKAILLTSPRRPGAAEVEVTTWI